MADKKYGLCHCRVCGRGIDRNVEVEGKDWVMHARNWFYCKPCYDNWIKNKVDVNSTNQDESFWYMSMVDYLYQDVRMPIDFGKLQSQWNHFIQNPDCKMTPKGIYFAVRYCYEVKHLDIGKAQGGIGIVKSVYDESAQYWVELENRKAGTLAEIIQQIQERKDRHVIEIRQPLRKKEKKPKWDLGGV